MLCSDNYLVIWKHEVSSDLLNLANNTALLISNLYCQQMLQINADYKKTVINTQPYGSFKLTVSTRGTWMSLQTVQSSCRFSLFG